MSKAYDRVEWNYLKALLLALGFHIRWIEWVMCCVSTITFSVLINDQPFLLIRPSRGLKQGDPLSHFLFVLCTEGLSRLLSLAALNGSISRMQFYPRGPAMHHLFFANDNLFVYKDLVDEVLQLQVILKTYGEATGQIININKSSISFGNLVEDEIKLKIKDITGIYNEGRAGTLVFLSALVDLRLKCYHSSRIG